MVLSGLLACAVVTWAATRVVIAYAQRRQLYDLPGARRSHQLPTPRGGGLGIVLTLCLAMLLAAWAEPALRSERLGALLGLGLVAWIGWVDDHRPLGAGVRLLVHAVAAVIAAGSAAPSGFAAWMPIVAVLGLVVAINGCNFMDGINGLAASQAALLAGGLAALFVIDGQTSDAALAAALAIACLVFLPFNFPRARIFLGDVGSGALGFMVALLLLWAWWRTSIVWPLLLLPPSAFLLDAGLTLQFRLRHRRHWTRPHREHLYQWLVRSGHSHTQVTLLYAGWTALVVAAMLLARQATIEEGVLMAILVYLLGGGLWWTSRRSLRTARRSRRPL